ncbi:hypothetical protein AAHH67_22625 [Niallia circulans]
MINIIQQKSDSKEELDIIETNQHKRVKQMMVPIKIEGELHYLFAFSSMKDLVLDNSLHIIDVPTPPVILSKSDSMKRCIEKIQSNLSRNGWILIGKSGTGKS